MTRMHGLAMVFLRELRYLRGRAAWTALVLGALLAT